MKLSTLALTIISTVALAQQKTKPYRSEFYAGLPFWESPVQPFKGEYPITEEEARKRIHLRFDYDTDNRITEVSVKIGSAYKEFEGFFGNLYIHAPLTKINYASKSEKHRFFDRFGNPVVVMDNVFEKVYEKDERGRNVSLSFLDQNQLPASDMFGIRKYEWKYLSDGSLVETRRNAQGELVPLRGSFEFLRTRIVYGSDGQVSSLQNVNERNEMVSAPCGATMFKYFYDSHGRFSRWEVYTHADKKAVGPSGTSGEQNVFDGHYLKDIVFFDSLGKPATHWSGVEQWNFEYDTYGNITRLNYRDASGKPKNAANGYAAIAYTWTTDGRFLLQQEYRDENDNLAEHPVSGVARSMYKRNEEGLTMEIVYQGKDGKPTHRKDNGAAVTRYTYNAKRIRTEMKLLDINNNQIK